MYISKEKTLPTCYNFIKELKILYGSRYVTYIQMELQKVKDQASLYNQEDKNVIDRAIQYINKG